MLSVFVLLFLQLINETLFLFVLIFQCVFLGCMNEIAALSFAKNTLDISSKNKKKKNKQISFTLNSPTLSLFLDSLRGKISL